MKTMAGSWMELARKFGISVILCNLFWGFIGYIAHFIIGLSLFNTIVALVILSICFLLFTFVLEKNVAKYLKQQKEFSHQPEFLLTRLN